MLIFWVESKKVLPVLCRESICTSPFFAGMNFKPVGVLRQSLEARSKREMRHLETFLISDESNPVKLVLLGVCLDLDLSFLDSLFVPGFEVRVRDLS